MDQTHDLQIFSMTLSQLNYPHYLCILVFLEITCMNVTIFFQFLLWDDDRNQVKNQNIVTWTQNFDRN